jgi:hypothetical protein
MRCANCCSLTDLYVVTKTRGIWMRGGWLAATASALSITAMLALIPVIRHTPSSLHIELNTIVTADTLTFKDSLVFYEFVQRYPGLQCDDVNWVISSPNATWTVPAPPIKRQIQLRQDGRFGLDDPLQCPQPTSVNHEYLACIPTLEHDEASRYWHTPLTADDIVRVDGSPPTYQLSTPKRRSMERPRAQLADRVTVFQMRVSPTLRVPLETLYQRYNAAYQVLLERVKQRPFVQYRWATLGRWALEIIAYIDYYAVFLPRISLPRRNVMDSNRVGALAVTDELVQDFFKMGLPVWHIRPLSSPTILDSKLLYLTPPVKLRIELTPAAGHNVLDIFDFWSPQYLGTLHDWARHTPLQGGLAGGLIFPAKELISQTSNKRKLVGGNVPSLKANKKLRLAGYGDKREAHIRIESFAHTDVSCLC